jgi:hypothetical protein
MHNLFNQHNEQIMENFEIIFDRAKSETFALSDALDYYDLLSEQNISVDIYEVIDLAETYGWDISSIKKEIKQNG